MKFSLNTFVSVPCLAALLAIAGSAHADIVNNGTFAGGTGTTIPGWSNTGSGTTPGTGITAINLGNGATPYGDNIPDINGATTAAYFVDDNSLATNPETLSQLITLSANTSYSLTFDLFATNSGSGNTFNFLLTDGVGPIASSTFGNGSQPGATPVPVGVWTLETLNFTTGSSTTPYDLDFVFTSGETPAKDVVLTNVAIAATPEPSSFILLGSGLLAAAGVVRRRIAA
jgi:PEP-CTERM motif-containing protein